MRYLQRLLDGAPVSLAPGHAAPSPLVAHDQRLTAFSDLPDQFGPVRAQDPAPADAGPALPAESRDDAAGPSASQPALGDVQPSAPTRPVRHASDAAETAEPPRPPRPPTRADALPDADRSGAAPAATEVPRALSSEGERQVDRTGPVDRSPADATAEVPRPASHKDMPKTLWPIPASDFHPLESRQPTGEADPEAPHPANPPDTPVEMAAPPVASAAPTASSPSAGAAPEPPPVPPEPTPAGPEPSAQPSPPPAQAATAVPAMDLAPSPLAQDPPPYSAAPAPDRDSQTEPAPQPRTVERVVERPPADAPTPHPMTAATASVIGPIEIGRPGPREMRARGWG